MSERQENFARAVEWVQKASRFMFTEKGFLSEKYPPDRVLLQLSLDIHFKPTQAGGWTCEVSEEAAAKLLSMNETSLGARQLCREISACFLSEGRELPEPFRVFSCLFLSGLLKDPPAQRRKETWFRNQFLICITWRVANEFDLRLSSGDATSIKNSACDAVVEGLALNGYHLSDGAIRHLLHSKKPADVRLREETQYLIGEATRIKMSRPDIAATWTKPPKAV